MMFLWALGLVASIVAAAPISERLVARNPGIWVTPPSNGLPYLGLLAIAICVPIIVIVILMYLYHRRHGHYPQFGRKRGHIGAPIVTAAAARRTRRLGVWRAPQTGEGVPGYTMEAGCGEMSLGIGRKRSDEPDQYEMEETLTPPPNSGEGRTTREPSVATAQEADGTIPALTKPNEVLPPYIPPPAPAVVADGGGLGKVASRQSQNSTSNRLSFPRAVTSTSRRSSRVET